MTGSELRARAGEARGTIVVFNHAFDTTTHPFLAYSRAVLYRAYGADSAAAVGGVAALVRSVTPHSLATPDTGGLSYADTVRRASQIPGAAITVEDAEMLQRMQGPLVEPGRKENPLPVLEPPKGCRGDCVDGAGRHRRHRIADGYSPVWSRDGTKLVFAGKGGGLFISNADGSNVRQLTTKGNSPAWRP